MGADFNDVMMSDVKGGVEGDNEVKLIDFLFSHGHNGSHLGIGCGRLKRTQFGLHNYIHQLGCPQGRLTPTYPSLQSPPVACLLSKLSILKTLSPPSTPSSGSLQHRIWRSIMTMPSLWSWERTFKLPWPLGLLSLPRRSSGSHVLHSLLSPPPSPPFILDPPNHVRTDSDPGLVVGVVLGATLTWWTYSPWVFLWGLVWGLQVFSLGPPTAVQLPASSFL